MSNVISGVDNHKHIIPKGLIVVLLIVDLTAKTDAFPIHVLNEADDALVKAGFKKEVHTVVKPGKAYSLTYDDQRVEKRSRKF